MSISTITTARAGADTHVLSTPGQLPGLGVLPINAFVLHAREPVLVDTGLAATASDFLQALGALVDPADLRWIWITHADADHVGALRLLLEAAPRARIVTNYLGLGKLALQQLPVDRAYLINPGQPLDVGDRQLLALRPPLYDAPETMGFLDMRTRQLFSSDAFGALLDRSYESAEAIAPALLRERLHLWATIDAPWLHPLGREGLVRAVRRVADLAPERIFSSHLPPASAAVSALLAHLAEADTAVPFVGPDQAALEASVAELTAA
ncbi:MAG: MBL fold metallo-hydrolase [Burkholderiales bacterium]|nr:MBL fold metallo-hydrolase [Burkholderiales bacterium]